MADDLENSIQGQAQTELEVTGADGDSASLHNVDEDDVSQTVGTPETGAGAVSDEAGNAVLQNIASEGPTISVDDVLADESDAVTEHILQQALSEASAGTFDRIEQSNLDSDTSALYANAVSSSGSTDGKPTQSSSQAVLAGPQPDNALTDQSNSKISVVQKQPVLQPSAPLGSKNNPIRIVQQGNTYTSMQNLSHDQIQQIVKVLQQQNVQKVDGASKAVFNPETNTRIVYKVVPPKSGNAATAIPGGMTARQYHEQKYGPTKPRKRPVRESEDEEPSSDSGESDEYHLESDSDPGEMPDVDARELSPTEKIRKKREKPITRSGRKVRPPKHMVKEYKQIHRVDWYEDYDDDDGGYSDIYDSDTAEPGTSVFSEDSRRKYPCVQCDKAYIGAGGLARHYRMSGHGDPDSLAPMIQEQTGDSADTTTADPQSTATAAPSTSQSTDPSTSVTPVTSTPAAPAPKRRGRPPKKKPTGEEAWRPPPHISSRMNDTGEPRPRGRPPNPDKKPRTPGQTAGKVGRPPLTPAERRARREQRLREYISSYSADEILSVMCPRLARDDVSLYNILESGLACPKEDERPTYTVMLQKFTELQAKMIEMGEVCLRSIAEGEQVDDDKEAIQIATEAIAHSIGVEPGFFEVSDLPGLDDDDEGSQPDTAADADENSTDQSQSVLSQQQQIGNQHSTAMVADVMETEISPDTHVVSLADSVNAVSQLQLATTAAQLVVNPTTKQMQISPTLASQAQINASPVQTTDIVTERQITAVQLTEPQTDEEAETEGSYSVANIADNVTTNLASALSSLSAGDVLRINGQNIVIPEGAKLIQTDKGLVLYKPT